MAVGHSSATGRTSHYHVGAEKRNLDLLNELSAVGKTSFNAMVATPTSGILNTVRNSMSNGNQQDSSSLTMSSTIGCLGSFGIIEILVQIQQRLRILQLHITHFIIKRMKLVQIFQQME